MIFGTTDAAGRTVRVRLPKLHPEQQWCSTRSSATAISANPSVWSSRAAIGHFPYVLDVENEYLACGYSDANGYTYYAQSRTPRNVNLYAGTLAGSADTDWCAPGPDHREQRECAGRA